MKIDAQFSESVQTFEAQIAENDSQLSANIGDFAVIPDKHKDAVNSVNGKQGDVVLTAEDVGALPADTEFPEAVNIVPFYSNPTDKQKAEIAAIVEKIKADTGDYAVLMDADGTILHAEYRKNTRYDVISAVSHGGISAVSRRYEISVTPTGAVTTSKDNFFAMDINTGGEAQAPTCSAVAEYIESQKSVTPLFDLAEKGMPTHTIGGGWTSVDFDTTEVRTAMRKGVVGFMIPTDHGNAVAYCASFEIIGMEMLECVSAFAVEGDVLFMGDIIIQVTNASIFVYTMFRMTERHIAEFIEGSGYQTESQVKALINDAIGVIENGSY